MPSDYDVCVMGAGPAGMMAAITARQSGMNVCVLEQNSNAGRKLLVTGGGRCNLTHAGSIDDFVRACKPYGRTLKPAFYALSPQQTLAFFHERGLRTYVDDDGCVFPTSERAGDVHRILVEQMRDCGVDVVYGKPVASVEKQGPGFVIATQSNRFQSRAVIVAAGGKSWPQTGSRGDGYQIAQHFGHTVEPAVGILCPMVAAESWPGTLQGLSLENVGIRVKVKSKATVFSGKMVFTSDGIGGPAVFDVSRVAAELLTHQKEVPVTVDFCPGRDRERLLSELIELCAVHPRKDIAAILAQWFPKRLANYLQMCACGAKPVQGCHLSKSQRRNLIEALKATALTLVRSGPLEKATVTRGGVCCKEIDSKTMQSRLCQGLYFAGEVMDIDGPCGGYNLQIAFSTGALAGLSAAKLLGKRST